jgi:hypothetical protein
MAKLTIIGNERQLEIIKTRARLQASKYDLKMTLVKDKPKAKAKESVKK